MSHRLILLLTSMLCSLCACAIVSAPSAAPKASAPTEGAASAAPKASAPAEGRTEGSDPEPNGAEIVTFLVAGVVVTGALTLAAPFLEATSGIAGLVGLVIIFLGLSAAWRVSKSRVHLVLDTLPPGAGAFGALLLTVLLLGCGPRVEIEGDDSALGAGGTSSTSSSMTSAGSSTPPSCGDLVSCCEAICAAGAAMPCAPPAWKDGCLCDQQTTDGDSPTCLAAFLGWQQCFLAALPDALVCHDSQLLFSCSVVVPRAL
jgi:hypothetical protein